MERRICPSLPWGAVQPPSPRTDGAVLPLPHVHACPEDLVHQQELGGDDGRAAGSGKEECGRGWMGRPGEAPRSAGVQDFHCSSIPCRASSLCALVRTLCRNSSCPPCMGTQPQPLGRHPPLHDLALDDVVVKDARRARVAGLAGGDVDAHHPASLSLTLWWRLVWGGGVSGHSHEGRAAGAWMDQEGDGKQGSLIPPVGFPCRTVSSMMASCGSKPEFSARIFGTPSSASANASTPSFTLGVGKERGEDGCSNV